MIASNVRQHNDAAGIATRFVELASTYDCVVENEDGERTPISGALCNSRFTRALVLNAIGLLGMLGNRMTPDDPIDPANPSGMFRFTMPVLLALDYSVEVASRRDATISLKAFEESADRIRTHIPGRQAPDNIVLAITAEAEKLAATLQPDVARI